VSELASEPFSAAERDALSRVVTDIDGPVFALWNLPEATKGALFARYSRSSKSLRRLYLDEFAEPAGEHPGGPSGADDGRTRAAELYEKVLVDFGDDSVAQLGGAHLACEQVSNVATKVLERPRLMAYLEQSTRYVPFDQRLPDGRWRYWRDPDVLRSPVGEDYVAGLDALFETYATLRPALEAHLLERAGVEHADPPLRRAARAAALDGVRGLLPAATLSNLGLFGSAQSYESLLVHLEGHPLAEVRALREAMLAQLRRVIPEMLSRVDQPTRGGAHAAYLRRREERLAEAARSLGAFEADPPAPGVSLLAFDPDGELRVLAAALAQAASTTEPAMRAWLERQEPAELDRLFRLAVGERTNRRHRPGRAFEATHYRFEIVCDYGAFRDLQRHRMLSIDWQPLGCELGFDVPPELTEAGLADVYVEAMERASELYGRLRQHFDHQAAYAVPMGYRIRFVLDMNAREAMHLIELRTQPQGHRSYRAVAQAMLEQIQTVARHRRIASAMAFADLGPTEGLGRLAAERRSEDRLRSLSTSG